MPSCNSTTVPVCSSSSTANRRSKRSAFYCCSHGGSQCNTDCRGIGSFSLATSQSACFPFRFLFCLFAFVSFCFRFALFFCLPPLPVCFRFL